MKTTPLRLYPDGRIPVCAHFPRSITIEAEVFHMDWPASFNSDPAATPSPHPGSSRSDLLMERVSPAESTSLTPNFQNEELNIRYDPDCAILHIHIRRDDLNISLIEMDRKYGGRYLAEELNQTGKSTVLNMDGVTSGIYFLKFRLKNGCLHSVLKIVIR